MTEAEWQYSDHSHPNNLACLKFANYSDTQYRLPDWRGIFERNAGTNSKLKTANGTAYSGGNPGDAMLDMMQNHAHGIPLLWLGTGGNVDVAGGGINTRGTAIAPTQFGSYGSPRLGNETRSASGSEIKYIFVED